MVGAALVEEADEFWPSPVGDIPLSPVMISPSRLTVLSEIFIVLLFLLTAL
jgi:hypothetical protein